MEASRFGLAKPGAVMEESIEKERRMFRDDGGRRVRQPAVAGMFYGADTDELRAEIERCFLSPYGPGRLPMPNPEGPRRIVGLVSPHAGLTYSGPTAAHGYYRLAEDGLPEVAVLIGVNHRGYGAPVAVDTQPVWRTPLGDTEIDLDTARKIASLSRYAEEDELAHRLEHSLEVQVPFLQYTGGGRIRMVPVLMGVPVWDKNALSVAEDVGESVAQAVAGRNAVVIASTDMSHYESRESAERKDSQAIRHILDLDEGGLLETVRDLDISMCGVVPVAAALAACRHLGVKSAAQLAYSTSGDITGDYSQVVGYTAIELDR